jgi:dipeptidyl aminopeptidase/acylaminoacyl peptidase
MTGTQTESGGRTVRGVRRTAPIGIMPLSIALLLSGGAYGQGVTDTDAPAADAVATTGIIAREPCPARDPDYGDYRTRQMANYRQEAAAAKAQGLTMRPREAAESSILTEAEYLARGAPGVTCERITYRSDGLKVIGYLWIPADARAGDRLPLLVFHRGGALEDSKLRPNTQFGFDRFVRAGFVVIGTQYRGNDGGEGREEFGGAEVRDVLAVLRVGQALPYVDPQRVYALGYSRGGMMALLAARAGAPYRAIATVGAPTDLRGATAAGAAGGSAPDPRSASTLATARRLIPGFDADPDAALRARSAIVWADEIAAPVLVMHGGADPIVSAKVHAEPFAARLRALGKTHELVVYEGDTHGLQISGRERDERILEWFRRFDTVLLSP